MRLQGLLCPQDRVCLPGGFLLVDWFRDLFSDLKGRPGPAPGTEMMIWKKRGNYGRKFERTHHSSRSKPVPGFFVDGTGSLSHRVRLQRHRLAHPICRMPSGKTSSAERMRSGWRSSVRRRHRKGRRGVRVFICRTLMPKTGKRRRSATCSGGRDLWSVSGCPSEIIRGATYYRPIRSDWEIHAFHRDISRTT